MDQAPHISTSLSAFRPKMRAALRIWLSCVVALLVICGRSDSSTAVAEEPGKVAAAADQAPHRSAVTGQEIRRWINELGHDAFTVRQMAASQLLSAGMAAREPLLAIVDGPDPETRAAARRLVAMIDQTEFYRRLEAFAGDTDGRQGLTLPGWEQYQKLVGSEPPARALFVDMQRHEGALISAALGGSERVASDLLEARLVRLLQWQAVPGNRLTAPPLGSCAAMVFLGSISEIGVSDSTASLIEALLQRSPIQEMLRPDRRQEAVRRLAVGWLLNCPAKNENILGSRLNIISAMGLDDALPLPLAVVAGDKPYQRVQAGTRAFAILVVGQLGGAEHVDQLEPLLQDVSLCFPQMQIPGQPAATVQVRDVALAVMVQLTDQRPADYGYANARLQQAPKLFQIQTLFRENDQQREEAIAKWHAWRAAKKTGTAKTN